MLGKLVMASLWLLGFAAFCLGCVQEPAQQQGPPVEPTPPVAMGQCPSVREVDAQGRLLLEQFTVRSVTLRHPFEFLPWVHAQLDGLRGRLTVVKDGPYRTTQQSDDVGMLKKDFQLPDTNFTLLPIRFTAVIGTVDHCRDGQLDVEYDVLTTQFLPGQTTAEAHQGNLEHPERAANVTRPKRLQVVPKAGYNASDNFSGGGGIRILTSGRPASLDSFTAEGAASHTYQSASGALNGSLEPPSFGTISWRLGYSYASLPTDRAALGESRFEGRVLASTRPLGETGLVFRFGGQAEGGHLQSGFTAAELGPNLLSNSAYGSTRIYSGATFSTKHVAFRASYGIEVGGNGGFGVDWWKQVGDTSLDAWFPIGSHRPVQIESRFTAGTLDSVRGTPIPVAKRFFGGNAQQSFLDEDDWDFRANPVIRSIPARQFNLTSSGPGAERFYALNLTIAPVVFRQPLLPSEVTEDQGFNDQVNEQWDVLAAFTAANHITKDRKYPEVLKQVSSVHEALVGLSAALQSAHSAVAPADEALFSACSVAAQFAKRRAESAMREDPAVSADARYGFIAALVKEGKEQRVPKAIDACLNRLSPALHDANVTSASRDLNATFDALEQAYGKLDRAAAQNRAARELSYPKRIFGTIVHDLNVWSVSPVFLFDTARIWPEATSGAGLRYGVGGGIRLSLVSHANFTLGYARNLHRAPNEGTGALFFSIFISELLR